MGKRGKFIVFEGLDGCGKTTQLEKLREYLCNSYGQNGSRKIYVTREPGDSLPGALCRSINRRSFFAQPETEALLYAADRYEHVKTEILPQLEAGNHVLCDRYYFASLAYQGGSSGMDDIMAYNRAVMGLLRADATLYIDVSPEECERRRALRNEAAEKYENIEFAKATKERYFNAFKALWDLECVIMVDGSGDAGEVFRYVRDALEKNVFTN